MTIGVLHMQCAIPGARSLKERRRGIRSLKERLGNRFNCSVAEVGDKEKWSRAELAVCVVSDDSAHANTQLNEIVRFASTHHLVELLDYQIEML